MRASIISMALLTMMSTGVYAQQKAYEVSKDPKNEQVVFKGLVTFEDLNKETSFDWMKSGGADYKPNKKKVSYLREHLKNYTLLVFMGTWCGDSHDMVPKLFKVLGEAGYPATQVTMYGVEREKTTRSAETQKYNITLLPTVVVLKDGNEVGRIIETVHKNVESDLAAILPD